MFNILNDTVLQIKCGEKSGTGFLITKNICITVFHVIVDYPQSEISVWKGGLLINNAHLDKSIDDECKTLDFAILNLDSEIIVDEYLEFGLIEQIEAGTKWTSRGFPGSKSLDGENILDNNNNQVNQHLKSVADTKIDIHLNHNQKWPTYEGLSGAPLIISKKVVGIINSELSVRMQSKELHALSTNALKNILTERGISFCDDFLIINEFDTVGLDLYNELSANDNRNLPEKLKSVCSTISDLRVGYFCRELAAGKLELAKYSDQSVSSLKYRIFETCQKELLDFVEERENPELTIKEIDVIIDQFTAKAKEIADVRSSDYKYPFTNKDLMRKLILDLINDCFLSFDKEGIYEG